MMGRVSNWVKAMRLQTALVTSLSLWAGYITVSGINLDSALFLGTLGVLFHIFGFTMNEVEDYKYDAGIGNGSSHPIAQGKINLGQAKLLYMLALVSCITMSFTVSVLYRYNIYGTLALCASVLPGVMYNKYSKEEWWSNIYLSAWVAMMVLAGSMYAGMPNYVTALISIALAIQAFIQVVEGDLKDLSGKESSFCKRLGVDMISPYEYVNRNTIVTMDDDKLATFQDAVISYTKRFVAIVYGLKFTELLILMYIPFRYAGTSPYDMRLYSVIFFINIIVFITSMSALLVYVYDRDKIKKASSVHELSGITLVGLSLMPFSVRGGIMIAVLPIIWYIAVNKLLYQNSLNPDI